MIAVGPEDRRASEHAAIKGSPPYKRGALDRLYEENR